MFQIPVHSLSIHQKMDVETAMETQVVNYPVSTNAYSYLFDG